MVGAGMVASPHPMGQFDLCPVSMGYATFSVPHGGKGREQPFCFGKLVAGVGSYLLDIGVTPGETFLRSK